MSEKFPKTLGEVWGMVHNGHGVYHAETLKRAVQMLSKEFGEELPVEKLPIRAMKTDKTAQNPKYWRIMNPDSEGIPGMDSEEFGPWLCNVLNVKYSQRFMGRGSQASECARALIEELELRKMIEEEEASNG